MVIKKFCMFAVGFSAVAIVIVTLLPMTGSHEWWIRMWDFPRPHIFFAALVVAMISIIIWKARSRIIVASLAICAAYQGALILPYTPLTDVEIELSDLSDRPTISLLSANVLMQNEEYWRLIELIEEESPDVVFLMETDARWEAALEEMLAKYSTVVSHPLENHYGLIFATNLEVIEARSVLLVDDKTPTLLAELRDAAGAGLHFIGLHPRPPVPGNDTEERDAQIKRAATLANHAELPVIAMGDFNDAAWSWTAKRYKHHGNFLDPRVGRGMLSSFDANHPILRFPIDQLYLTKGIDLISFERKQHIGSDHFPIGAVISINGRKES